MSDTLKGAMDAAYPMDAAEIAAGDAFNVWEITGEGEPEVGPIRDAEFGGAAGDYAEFDAVVEAAGPWAIVAVLAGLVLGAGFGVWVLVTWVRG